MLASHHLRDEFNLTFTGPSVTVLGSPVVTLSPSSAFAACLPTESLFTGLFRRAAKKCCIYQSSLTFGWSSLCSPRRSCSSLAPRRPRHRILGTAWCLASWATHNGPTVGTAVQTSDSLCIIHLRGARNKSGAAIRSSIVLTVQLPHSC